MKYICTNCFADDDLIRFIESRNNIGVCDICKNVEIPRVDIEEVIDFMSSLLSCFEECKEEQEGAGDTIINLIHDNWSFFKDKDTGEKILSLVIKRIDTEINYMGSDFYFSDNIMFYVDYWDTLRNDLKWNNRYITNIKYLTDGELGWDGFLANQIVIKPSDSTNLFYRGRLHHELGDFAYEPSKMYNPPKDKSSAGRANPEGIPYLYLCDNEETVPYEIRGSYLDEFTLGTFKLRDEFIEGIRISDFTEKSGLFPSTGAVGDDISERIKSTLLKKKISKDLSKPIRRYDSEIDYIPTQFICEFLKVFTDAQGIKFKSSLHTEGNVIVIFDPKLMECTDVKRMKINRVNIETKEHNMFEFLLT